MRDKIALTRPTNLLQLISISQNITVRVDYKFCKCNYSYIELGHQEDAALKV